MKRLLLFAALVLVTIGLEAQQPQDALKAKKPGIVAHRGFHRFEGSAENSISSMQHAVAHDFEGTEFDVQLTSDNVAIVFHDSKMQGLVICDTPFDTLRNLPAFTLRSGETVPTLDEFLEACSLAIKEQNLREKHTQLFFEIKPLQRKEQLYHLLGQIIEAIGKYQLHDDIFFISFDLDACVMMAQLLPDTPVAYLEGDLSPKQLQEKGITDIDYHWSKFTAHPEWVKEAHDLGMTVNVWTVNTPEKAQEMLQLGVDYITTDEPLQMREWLGRAMTE
jgi:glycerophosphoryl diester phosphodiesterase